MRTLPIGPEEAFVLSRVDGRTTESDIAASTGMDSTRVSETLQRLMELGAVAYGEQAVKAASAAKPPTPSGSVEPQPETKKSARPPPIKATKLDRPIIEAASEAPPEHSHPAAALYDPAELDEEVDIDLQRKRRILDLFYRLESLTHYELFELETTAEKKEVKQAYYSIVGIFHPDKYFGKKLGSFKPKLEKIFARLTEAHDTLTRKKLRAEYDKYLESQQRTKQIDTMLHDERARAKQVDQINRMLVEQARAAERSEALRPPRTPREAQPATPPPVKEVMAPGADARERSGPPAEPLRTKRPRPSSDPVQRRRALARKLRQTSVPPPPPDTDQPNAPSGGVKEIVADDLRRRYDARLTSLRDNQVQKYLDAADAAESDNNPVSAANALRIATSLAPDDEELRQRYEEMEHRASSELADSYVEQARYEESNGRYAEAARSYERAARGMVKKYRLFERAAHCLVEADGDMRKAAELGKEAVQLAPDNADVRVTLARAYLLAGMPQSAIAELERAEQLDSSNEAVKDWLKRARRGA